jgi:predicted RNA-binding protein with RPS1 domain
VLIISIDKRNRKIGLSLRELKQAQEEQELKDFLAQQQSGSSTATLGDIMQAASAGTAAPKAEETEKTEPAADTPEQQ